MDEREIIEADFFQYYNLDIDEIGFSKCARLLLQLPFESRFVQAHCESKDWDWDKEVQSRILMKLDTISCQLANIFKKKGTQSSKPDKQFQPDYVKDAKKELDRQRSNKYNKEDMEKIKAFWAKRNPSATFLGVDDE